MTSSSDFSKTELESLSVWRLPDVSNYRNDVPEEALIEVAAPPPTLTAEALENLQRQAYAEAAAEGREAGYEAGYREGYRVGLEQGQEEGRETGRQALRAQGQRLSELMALLSEPLQTLDEQVERELVALAVAVAKQLVRRELKTDPNQIVAVVRQALSVLPVSARNISLHLHPEDADLVRAALALDEDPPWKIVEDPVMTRGGCRVHTDISRVDASLERRLGSAIANLLGGEREADARP